MLRAPLVPFPILNRFNAAAARGFRPPTPTPPPPTAAQVAAAAAEAERAAQDAEYAASLAMDEAREASEAEAALAEVERHEAEEAAAAVAEAEAAAAVAAEEERREERRRRAAALPPPPAAGGASIVVRMADGRRVNRRFAPESPLRHVIEWVEGEAPAVGAYSLATSYPAHVLGEADHGASLEALGLGGGGTLFLQEEDDDDGAGPAVPRFAIHVGWPLVILVRRRDVSTHVTSRCLTHKRQHDAASRASSTHQLTWRRRRRR